MLQLRIKQGRRHVPLFDLPTHLGRQEAYREIGDAVDSLIAFMDDLGGDPDLEDTNDAEGIDEREPDDDAQGDISWTEWHTRGRHKVDQFGSENRSKRGWGHTAYEDDEDDDADTCPAADDQGSDGGRWFDRDGLPGDAADSEDGHDREADCVDCGY